MKQKSDLKIANKYIPKWLVPTHLPQSGIWSLCRFLSGCKRKNENRWTKRKLEECGEKINSKNKFLLSQLHMDHAFERSVRKQCVKNYWAFVWLFTKATSLGWRAVGAKPENRAGNPWEQGKWTCVLTGEDLFLQPKWGYWAVRKARGKTGKKNQLYVQKQQGIKGKHCGFTRLSLQFYIARYNYSLIWRLGGAGLRTSCLL